MRTVRSGRVKRLMPGDEVVVQVGVEPGDVTVEDATMEVVIRHAGGDESTSGFRIEARQEVNVTGSGILKAQGWGEWVDDVVGLVPCFLPFGLSSR